MEPFLREGLAGFYAYIALDVDEFGRADLLDLGCRHLLLLTRRGQDLNVAIVVWIETQALKAFRSELALHLGNDALHSGKVLKRPRGPLRTDRVCLCFNRGALIGLAPPD